MASLLDLFTGDNADAMIAVGSGLLSRNPAAGFQRAQSLLAQAPMQRMQQSLLQSRLEQEQLQNEEARRARDQQLQIQNIARQSFITPEQAAARSMGPMPDGGMAPEVRPGFDSKGFIQKLGAVNPLQALEWEQKLTKEKKPISVAAGASLVDPDTLKPVFTAPKEQSLPAGIQEYEYAKAQGFNGSLADYEIAKRRAGAPVSNVSVNTGQKGLDNELKLRGDFRSEPIYKAHQEVQSAHSQISAALKQNSPAGDLAGATKIMKILDPGSVVRESELGMAMAASGALDRLQYLASNVVNGTKLTPKQRADFQQLADKLYAESASQYNAKRGEYAGFAKDYGLNAERIAGPAVTSPKLPTPAAPGGAAPKAKFLGFE